MRRTRHGEDTPEAEAASRQGRVSLVSQGWAGVCQWVADLLSVDGDEERERRRHATERRIGYFAKQVARLNDAERLKAGRAIGGEQV